MGRRDDDEGTSDGEEVCPTWRGPDPAGHVVSNTRPVRTCQSSPQAHSYVAGWDADVPGATMSAVLPMKPTLARYLSQCRVGWNLNPYAAVHQGGVPDARRFSRPAHWSQPPPGRHPFLSKLVCVSSSDDRARHQKLRLRLRQQQQQRWRRQWRQQRHLESLIENGGRAKIWGKFGGKDGR